MVRDARWKVAAQSRLPRLIVAGIVMDILETAKTRSRREPAGFSAEVSAVALDVERETIEKVYAELERLGS